MSWVVSQNVLPVISYVGSHALSLAYLFLYGRYISVVGRPAVRVADAFDPAIDLTDKRATTCCCRALRRQQRFSDSRAVLPDFAGARQAHEPG